MSFSLILLLLMIIIKIISAKKSPSKLSGQWLPKWKLDLQSIPSANHLLLTNIITD